MADDNILELLQVLNSLRINITCGGNKRLAYLKR